MPNGFNKKAEWLSKYIARRIFAFLASTRRKKRHSIGNQKDIKKIIVVRQHNQFGDVLCTIPLLRALWREFNLEELAVVVSPKNIDAVLGCKYATRVINYDKLSFLRNPILFVNFIKELRKGYDVLLVPSNVSMSLTNDVMAFFVKAKMKIGPKSLEGKSNRTSSVYDIALDLQWNDGATHQVFRNMMVAAPLGIVPQDADLELEYNVKEDVLKGLSNLFKGTKNAQFPRIAIHAGAGKPYNRWDIVNFAKLSKLLYDNLNARLYFTEGSFDHETMEHLVNLMDVEFVRIRNRSIQFVAAVLRRMDLVITNDTGIMHLAAAVGVPTLSLFGKTDPLQWAPRDVRGGMHGKYRFILGKNGEINSISIDKVFNIAKKMLPSSAIATRGIN
jgi:ADP-heptose:LPS heptosyltransferase